MSKVAVTGASGFIGSKMCEDLGRDNDLVRVDLRGVDKPVDMQNLEALREAFAGCETVVHLARVPGRQGVSWEDTQTNIACTYNVFEAARLAGCKRVIIASSNHAVGYYEIDGAPQMYEPKSGTLLRVDIPPRPSGLYGVWKVFGEALGRYYSDEYGLQVACLRIAAAQVEGPLENMANWLNLTDDQKRKRIASMYVSHRDLAGLVRAIMASDVPYGIVYAVSDNATRFYDLEEGRRLYGFWPVDGYK
jgi:NAD+ dependent glucose-6-phosphate dehydrogenase